MAGPAAIPARLILRGWVRRRDTVSNRSLAEVARSVGLPQHLFRGNCERSAALSVGQLGDALEALIGAVFLDSDYETAERVVLRLVGG